MTDPARLTDSDAPFYREVSGKRRILLAVTYVVHPFAGDFLQPWDGLRTGRAPCGWVARASGHERSG